MYRLNVATLVSSHDDISLHTWPAAYVNCLHYLQWVAHIFMFMYVFSLIARTSYAVTVTVAMASHSGYSSCTQLSKSSCRIIKEGLVQIINGKHVSSN